MSKDKHRKRDRAFAFLRTLHWTHTLHRIDGNQRRMPQERYGTATISGRLPPVVAYCIERGWLKLKRVGRHSLHGDATNRRNQISAWTE